MDFEWFFESITVMLSVVPALWFGFWGLVGMVLGI